MSLDDGYTDFEVVYAPRCEGLGVNLFVSFGCRVPAAGAGAFSRVEAKRDVPGMQVVAQRLEPRREPET